jgi:catechol 2,3-dioxygenase-like lactoylglutathione lyase family enzyme
MINKIAFSHYFATDMERSVDFYQNILGFTLLFKRDDWSEFSVGGQRLAIRKVDEIESPLKSGGAVISFETTSIESLVAFMKGKNVRFAEEIQSYSYGKLATFFDPDNNLLGLYEPPKKEDVIAA